MEDCQVCCSPMEIGFSVGELGELDIRVCNAC
ncbi:MAG: CPXCG motif-containing cysteine-rich protein [Pseudomonadota bacterium]|nr:CPXCG motif-containing cysteine-rich protein [Pseudomonadota bacterium]